MSKYSSRNRQAPRVEAGYIHPVMRGIGCIMIVVVPILAYGASILLVNYGVGKGWPIPPNWLGTPEIHPLLLKLSFTSKYMASVLAFLQAQTNLIANIVFAVAITVVIGGIMSMIYGYIYQIFGPPKYGPTDAPPVRVKLKRYKR